MPVRLGRRRGHRPHPTGRRGPPRPAHLAHRRADGRPGAGRLHRARTAAPPGAHPRRPRPAGRADRRAAGCGCTCSTPTRCATASGCRRSTVASGDESVILGRTEDATTLGHAITDAGAPRRAGHERLRASPCSPTGCSPSSPPPPTSSWPARTSPGCCSAAPGTAPSTGAHQVVGTDDIAAHAVLLEDLVAEMDRRLETIPPRRDKIEPTPATPDGARACWRSSPACCAPPTRCPSPSAARASRSATASAPRCCGCSPRAARPRSGC